MTQLLSPSWATSTAMALVAETFAIPISDNASPKALSSQLDGFLLFDLINVLWVLSSTEQKHKAPRPKKSMYRFWEICTGILKYLKFPL